MRRAKFTNLVYPRGNLPVFLWILLCSFSSLLGQEKYEKEYRLPTQEVPLLARDFVSLFEEAGKIRWFYEENLVGNSIEAKFKLDGERYSVEFDTTGSLQDIEVQQRWEALPQSTRKHLAQSLASLYSRYKLQKVQLQYAGPENVLRLFAQSRVIPDTTHLRYEIVVKGKTLQSAQLYELTYSYAGKLLKQERIRLHSSDHLEY